MIIVSNGSSLLLPLTQSRLKRNSSAQYQQFLLGIRKPAHLVPSIGRCFWHSYSSSDVAKLNSSCALLTFYGSNWHSFHLYGRVKDYARQQASLEVIHKLMKCDIAAMMGTDYRGAGREEPFSKVETRILSYGDEFTTKAAKGTCVRVSYTVTKLEEDSSILESCESFAFDVDDGGAFSPLNNGVQGLSKGAEFTIMYGFTPYPHVSPHWR